MKFQILMFCHLPDVFLQMDVMYWACYYLARKKCHSTIKWNL